MEKKSQVTTRRCSVDCYPSASEATIEALTEQELATLLSEQGAHVVEHKGRYWQAIARGFYEPVAFLTRLPANEVARPTWRCWGYRAALADQDSASANAAMPVHLISNLQSFGESMFTRKKREQLHRAMRELKFVRLTDSALLEAQGYGVYQSHAERLKLRRVVSKDEYLRVVSNWTKDSRQLLVAGLRGDTLCGYGYSYAVGETGYLSTLHVASEELRGNVTVGLYFYTLNAMKNSGLLAATSGFHRPENQGLATYKREVGFAVVLVPCKLVVPPSTLSLMKMLCPATYYRFTGQVPRCMRAAVTQRPEQPGH